MANPLPVFFDVLFTFLLTVFLVSKYGRLRRSYWVTAAVILTWFFSFAIVFVLPLDISTTFYWNCIRKWYCSQFDPSGPLPTGCEGDQPLHNETARSMCQAAPDCSCSEPWSYMSVRALPTFWSIIFWTSQLMTWLILPLMQGYMVAGDFSFWAKMWSSVKSNGLLYLSLGVILGIFLIYITVRNNLSANDVEEVIIAASNTWGLLLLVMMLGYGLVEVPRLLIRKSYLHHSLKLYYFRAAQLSKEMAEAHEQLDETYAEAREAAMRIPPGDPLHQYLNVLLLKCPFASSTHAHYREDVANDDTLPPMSLSVLTKIHAKLIDKQRIVNRCECLWENLLEKTFLLEDVIEQSTNPARRLQPEFQKPFKGPLKSYQPVLSWYWHVKVQPVLLFGLGILAVIMSLLLLWSEVLFFLEEPTLSVFALLLYGIGGSQHYLNMEIVTFLCLFYLSACAYRVIFKLRLLNFYYLVPHKQTDSSSLLFSAMLLARLTTPLCLNFLSVAHLDTHVTAKSQIHQPTAFTQVMGHVDVVAFIKDFNTYYPMAMVAVALITFFHLVPRVMRLLGFPTFLSPDDDAEGHLAEGRALVRTERRKRQQQSQSQTSNALRRGSKPRGASGRGRVDDDPFDQDGDEPAALPRPSVGQRDLDLVKETIEQSTASSGSRSQGIAGGFRRVFGKWTNPSYRRLEESADVEASEPAPRDSFSNLASERRQPPRNVFDDI